MSKFTIECPVCHRRLEAAKRTQSYTCPVCDCNIDVAKLAQQKNGGLPATISYEGGADTLVWKHPLTDFPMGTQLIVHESQEAVFFRNGEALDSFPAGRFTLETGVLPIMGHLLPLPVQGQPFHAEVYFINKTTLMNVKWGTNSKVGLFDPISGIHVELGASGSFNVRVTEPRRLLLKLVGTTDTLTQQQLFEGDKGFFRTLIMTRVKADLARCIKENNINVLEVDMHLGMLSAKLRLSINETLVQYGLEIPEFYVNTVVTPDEDPNFKRLKQQHADLYLKTREEQIRKSEAEAAFERKAVEAQTNARMKVISAQGDADVIRLKAQAEAEAYRMQAEAEAQEMRVKGYTYQQETARQVGVEAMKHDGTASGLGGMMGDVMQMGVGLGAVGSVMNMTRETIAPIGNMVSAMGAPNAAGTWNCACGQKEIEGNFCSNCGLKMPPASNAWDCACGQKDIVSNFCGNCGSKKPANDSGWDCICGQKDIKGNFCVNCGQKKGE